MGPEQRAEGVNKALQQLVEDLEKRELRPLRKESYLCAARCCDTAADHTQLVNCMQRCQQRTAAADRLVEGALQDFQARLQRCASRSQDTVQAGLPVKPSDEDIRKAQDKLANLVADCAEEHQKQIPKLGEQIKAGLQQSIY